MFLNGFAFQNLAPIYEQVADAFSHAKDKVIIAKVDADGEGKPLGTKYGVTGYPSEYSPCLLNQVSDPLEALKWFKADGSYDPYEGGRDLDALVSL